MVTLLRLLPLLPRVRSWIRDLLRQHATAAVPVVEVDLPRLSQYFPRDFLARARVVVVDRVPIPPLDDWGLPGAQTFKTMEASGITFDDTFFVERRWQRSERLFVHELVHVAQWERLGFNRFCLLYGVYLVQHDYWDSPLEVMARDLDATFARLDQPFDALRAAQERTDELLRGFCRQGLSHRLAAHLVLWL
jgi:hypothetical protein